MAHRKRPGTSGGNGMPAPGPAPCPAPHPAESCDLKALPARQRPLRYHKEPHDQKPLPHSCKAQYPSSKTQGSRHSRPEEDAGAGVEVKRYDNHEADSQPENERPATPSTPEHRHDHDEHQPDFHGEADSLDDDSSSDYINNTSDDEEDYDDGEFDINYLTKITLHVLV